MVKTTIGDIREKEYDATKEILELMPKFTDRGIYAGDWSYDSKGRGSHYEACLLNDDFDHALLSVLLKQNLPSHKTIAEPYSAYSAADKSGSTWPKGLYVFYSPQCQKGSRSPNSIIATYTARARNAEEDKWHDHDLSYDADNFVKAVKFWGLQKGEKLEEFKLTNNDWRGAALTGNDGKTYVGTDGRNTVVIIKVAASVIPDLNSPVAALVIADKTSGSQMTAKAKVKSPCGHLKKYDEFKKCEDELSAKSYEAFRKRQADEKWMSELGMPKGPAAESCTTSYNTSNGVQTSTTTCRRW